MDDRELRTSIDHESKIRDQIAKLTGQLEDVLEKTEQSGANPSLPILMELEENHSTEAEKRKAPRKKKSLKDKDGPKRTISVQLPPEVFEKIQQDELRDDMEANKTLENFLASQGLESYTNVLKRRGFKTINDLANLNEDDIDFKVKPVHKTRLLFVASSQRTFMEEDGKSVPETKKVKPADPDPEDEPKKTGPKRSAGRKPTKARPGAKAGRGAGAAKKTPPSKAAGAKKAGAKSPGRKPPPKKSVGSKKPAASDKPKKETPVAAVEKVEPPVADAKDKDEVIADDVSESLTKPTSEASESIQVEEPDEVAEVEAQDDELIDPTFEVTELNETEFPEYPEIVSIPGLALPPQPPNITRLVFGNGPFGITVYGTGNGLVVTHVEPEGSGAEMRVEVGDHVVELNGVEVPPNISDREFVEQLMSKARPVVLGFKRNGKDFTSANLEMMDDVDDTQLADADQQETYTVGGISMDEIDPEKNLADLFPSAGLEIYLDALKEMGAEKMEDLAYLRRSDLMDLDIDIAPADKKKLLELGLVAFLTKEGLADCVAYIRSVGVDMVDDLVYLKQSDVALMDLKQEYKDRLMDVLGRDS